MYANDCYETTSYEVSGAAADYRMPAAKSTESSQQVCRDMTVTDTRSCFRKDIAIKVLGVACLVCFSTITATMVLHFIHRSQWIEASAHQDRRLGTMTGKFTDEIDLLRRSQNEYSFNHDHRLTNISRETMKKVTILQEKMHEIGFLFAPRNCNNFSEDTVKSLNVTGGLIDIFIPSYFDTKEIYCDFTTVGGNWIVFQRRMNGEVDFYRDWIDYVSGFGKPSREFWLGLETIHQLTKNSNTELRIDMIERSGKQYYAKYSTFYVGPESDDYRLHVSGYSGNATDSFAHPPNPLGRHNNQRFSTRDADHDQSASRHCAVIRMGGWWYNDCQWSNLNGKYDIVNDWPGVVWYHEPTSRRLYMKYTEMKFRRKK